jgi:hypothetical protein
MVTAAEEDSPLCIYVAQYQDRHFSLLLGRTESFPPYMRTVLVQMIKALEMLELVGQRKCKIDFGVVRSKLEYKGLAVP